MSDKTVHVRLSVKDYGRVAAYAEHMEKVIGGGAKVPVSTALRALAMMRLDMGPMAESIRSAYKKGYRVGMREGNSGQSTPGMSGGTASPYSFGSPEGIEWTRGFQDGVAKRVDDRGE